MKLEGNQNNNVMVGSIEAGSNVTINQHQQAKPLAERYVEYEFDERAGVEEYTQRDVLKRAAFGVGSIVLACLAFVADLLSVSSYFGLDRLKVTGLFLFGCFAVFALHAKFLWLLLLPRSDETDRFKFGRFVHKGIDGKYLIYEMAAKCQYPRCGGRVKIVPAPPRERSEHQFIGVCSVGGKQHSYTCDYNRVGYPRKFDWRPLEAKA